jgi:hypothetical protein
MTPRPKYGWSKEEAALHRIIRSIAESLEGAPMLYPNLSMTVDEIEAKMHANLQEWKLQECNEQRTTT